MPSRLTRGSGAAASLARGRADGYLASCSSPASDGSLRSLKSRSYFSRQLRCSIRLLNEADQTFAHEKPDGSHFVVATGKNHTNIRANQLELPQRFFATHYRHVQIKKHESDLICNFAKHVQ